MIIELSDQSISEVSVRPIITKRGQPPEIHVFMFANTIEQDVEISFSKDELLRMIKAIDDYEIGQ